MNQLGTTDSAHRENAAQVLLILLQRRARTWSELQQAGLGRETVLDAVGLLAAQGECRIRVGPLLVELETGPALEDVPLP